MMAKTEKVLYVCKRCGAVGSIKQSHCVLCGATLDQGMQLRPGEKLLKAESSEKRCEYRKAPITLYSFLSAVFGVVSALALMLPVFFSGIISGIAAVVFAIVAFAKKKGGKSLSVIGVVLGGYTIFVNVFYFLWNFIYFIIN